MACALGQSGFGFELRGTGTIDIPHRTDPTGWTPPSNQGNGVTVRYAYCFGRTIPSRFQIFNSSTRSRTVWMHPVHCSYVDPPEVFRFFEQHSNLPRLKLLDNIIVCKLGRNSMQHHISPCRPYLHSNHESYRYCTTTCNALHYFQFDQHDSSMLHFALNLKSHLSP
jgi:hypothetical protein